MDRKLTDEQMFELDKRVALEVMKWQRQYPNNQGGWYTQPGFKERTPKFSASISAAFELVAEIQRRGYSLQIIKSACESKEWVVGFAKDATDQSLRMAKTLPLAITLAALAVAGKQSASPTAADLAAAMSDVLQRNGVANG